MLKIKYLLVAVSTCLISSISLFPAAGSTQSLKGCRIVTSSGKVIYLNKSCTRQNYPKTKACQGPYDSDGFPLALYHELEEVKKAIADAKQRGVRTIDDPKAQSALMALLSQMPFSNRIHSLLQEQRPLIEQVTATEDPIEKEKLRRKYAENSDVLVTNYCLSKLIKSLYMKFPEPLFYY